MKKFFYVAVYVLAVFSARLPADDDDNQVKSAAKAPAAEKGQPPIVLDKAAQLASGLKTIKLKPVTYRAELLSYGTALSAEPLLAMQNQYLNALAQQKSAAARAGFTQSSVNRLNYLHKEGIVSSRVLQDLQTTMEADRAALNSSLYLQQQIISNARLVWGEKLTEEMLHAPVEFNRLIQQRSTLLKITFPPNNGPDSVFKTIFVAPTAHRLQAVAAQLVSAVPQTDGFSQGQQYFYRVSSPRIKAGMRVNAWIPSQRQAQTGIIIPESALLWHLGQAVVFVKVADEQFSRRAVSAYHKVAQGYFVGAVLKAGEELVSIGAQMLLSQEFRGQIPSEDDD